MEAWALEALHTAADQEDKKRLWVHTQPMGKHRRMKREHDDASATKSPDRLPRDGFHEIHDDHELRPNATRTCRKRLLAGGGNHVSDVCAYCMGGFLSDLVV